MPDGTMLTQTRNFQVSREQLFAFAEPIRLAIGKTPANRPDLKVKRVTVIPSAVHVRDDKDGVPVAYPLHFVVAVTFESLRPNVLRLLPPGALVASDWHLPHDPLMGDS